MTYGHAFALHPQDNELEELRESRNDAVLSNIRTALFVELEAAEDAIENGEDFEPTDGSLAVTKALLDQNDWVTLELLFDEESVTKVGSMQAERYLYENLAKEFSEDPEQMMEEIFMWAEGGPDDDEEQYY